MGQMPDQFVATLPKVTIRIWYVRICKKECKNMQNCKNMQKLLD